MKKLKVVVAIILAVFISLFLFAWKEKDLKKEPVLLTRSGTAIIMSGAAARIPQEAGLLEELDNRGLLKDVVFISGVSSGALNAVMLNGILSGRMTWAEYKEILYNLKNSDIFIQEGAKRLPVNTQPSRNLYTKIVEGKLGYRQIGAVSYTHLRA